MENHEIKKYTESLYKRVGDAVMLNRAEIKGGNWQPEPNMCHHNVTIWCEHNSEYTPVRGWLYFDLPGLNYVKFIAHSVVLTPDNKLFDITPSNATQEYPFISSNLEEEHYAALVETVENGEINYEYTNA